MAGWLIWTNDNGDLDCCVKWVSYRTVGFGKIIRVSLKCADQLNLSRNAVGKQFGWLLDCD